MSILVTNNNATQEGYEKESAEVMAEETSSIQLQHHWKRKGTFSSGTKENTYVSTGVLVPEDCWAMVLLLN